MTTTTTTLSNLTNVNDFCSEETGKMYKTGHTITYLLLKKVLLIM